MAEEKKKQDRLKKEVEEHKNNFNGLNRDKSKLEDTILKMKKVQNDFYSFKDTIIATINKVLKSYADIESNLSCLSCLEFLEDPLMLICGHSICLKCFKTHSDPNSKDSIVFCEE